MVKEGKATNEGKHLTQPPPQSIKAIIKEVHADAKQLIRIPQNQKIQEQAATAFLQNGRQNRAADKECKSLGQVATETHQRANKVPPKQTPEKEFPLQTRQAQNRARFDQENPPGRKEGREKETKNPEHSEQVHSGQEYVKCRQFDLDNERESKGHFGPEVAAIVPKLAVEVKTEESVGVQWDERVGQEAQTGEVEEGSAHEVFQKN